MDNNSLLVSSVLFICFIYTDGVIDKTLVYRWNTTISTMVIVLLVLALNRLNKPLCNNKTCREVQININPQENCLEALPILKEWLRDRPDLIKDQD